VAFEELILASRPVNARRTVAPAGFMPDEVALAMAQKVLRRNIAGGTVRATRRAEAHAPALGRASRDGVSGVSVKGHVRDLKANGLALTPSRRLVRLLPQQFNDKPRDMAFRHKVLHMRRAEAASGHSPSLNHTRSKLNSHYLDRLLVVSA
jgi:hypothetical protein